MRQERTVQASIFDLFATHEIGHELKAMSRWLDEHRDLLGLVARDLVRVGIKATGRQGLSAEVLRCAIEFVTIGPRRVSSVDWRDASASRPFQRS